MVGLKWEHKQCLCTLMRKMGRRLRNQVQWTLAVTFVALIGFEYATADSISSAANGPPPNGAAPPELRGTAAECSPKSVALSRHLIANELSRVNQLNPIWFNDLTEDELSERQKQSLANIVMSNAGAHLLNAEGSPLIEIETSYLRPLDLDRIPMGQIANNTLFARMMQLKQSSHLRSIPISIDLLRNYPNQRCYRVGERANGKFVLVLGISVGPMEHLMDVVYNIPSKLRVSQPIEWHRAQVSLIVHQLSYEIVLHQTEGHNLSSTKCPTQVADITYIGPTNMIPIAAAAHQSPVAIGTSGLVINNHTVMHLERLFDDYTRPAVSTCLRQLFEFYLNSKQLPLSGLE